MSIYKHTFFNPKSNKAFWKTMKCMNKKQTTIPTLTTNIHTTTTNKEKAELLSTHFSNCFNHSLPPLDWGLSTGTKSS